jgi:beta-glucosidase
MTDPSLHATTLNSPAHQALALRAAEQGVVLLKNEKSLLPINTAAGEMSVNKIAVIGPNGGCVKKNSDGSELSTDPSNGDDDGYTPVTGACPAAINLLGSYTQYGPSVEVPTVHAALRKALSGGSNGRVNGTTAGNVLVQFEPGCEINHPIKTAAHEATLAKAVALAKGSDLAVLVLGDDQASSSEWGDRANLDLPGGQMRLLQEVAATGTPVVLVLVTGRTATFGGPDNLVLANVSAILAAFRPGQMGGVGISNLIIGKANPSGKLGQNWVRSAGQARSGASPWLQWRVGKWVANKRGCTDKDGGCKSGEFEAAF